MIDKEKFEVLVKFTVFEKDLSSAKQSVERVMTDVKRIGSNMGVTIKDDDGIEHKVQAATGTSEGHCWVHQEAAGEGSHGPLVKTIYED